jgi:glycerol-3-phosphate acyltransferase PlsY
MNMGIFGVSLVLAYLLGAIPCAVLISRCWRLPDPRTVGSNNPGATNMLRVAGKLPAVLTLLGDGLKGAVAVLLARFLELPSDWWAWIALAAIIGHLWPVFARFKGGKGVATFFGVALALCWPVGLMVLGIWLLLALCFRYSSLAALGACVSFPALLYLWVGTLWLVPSILITLLIILRHYQNIRRLCLGQETKIGKK